MSTPQSPLRPDPESFDKLYRGEPAGIPWDVHQAQPRLMELEALGGISGEVLDIGCGLGDNAIFLASCGHSVTGLDGSAAAIEHAHNRAAAAGVQVTFGVADATDLSGYTAQFDTVVDSALYHCLDDEGRRTYASALYRATRPGARWHLYCFSDDNINGVVAPMGAVPEANIRDTLTAAGWRIDFLGPTTYLGNAEAFRGKDSLPQQLVDQLPPEALEQMQNVAARFERIGDLLDDGRVHLPFTVVHAHRVD
ncbi:class I SAM-dependent methyltransferase [Mycobacterium sp. 21AC1]|nr:class I SAM-dependent methyltransferase [Mycobacterium sp. 21AC1]MDV3126079.1 class I SAM-dependent methyltransferase [Mycobacterium sp. 21AC1]